MPRTQQVLSKSQLFITGGYRLETPFAIDSVCVLVIQSYLTLLNTMDYSLPGSSVHRILQARIKRG